MPLNVEELFIIIVIAAVVIGPSHIPKYAEQLGRLVRTLRDMARGATKTLKEELGPEAEDLDFSKLDPRQYDPRRIVREALQEEDDDQSTTGRSTSRGSSGSSSGAAAGAGAAASSATATAGSAQAGTDTATATAEAEADTTSGDAGTAAQEADTAAQETDPLADGAPFDDEAT